MEGQIVLIREVRHHAISISAGDCGCYFRRCIRLDVAAVCPLDDWYMKNHIKQIKHKVDELEEAEILVPIGRPRKALTLDEIENKAERQAKRARSDRPRTMIDPWRCPKCGGWIQIDFCLKCEPWNGWY